jgi:excisionase family DNA binding protein
MDRLRRKRDRALGYIVRSRSLGCTVIPKMHAALARTQWMRVSEARSVLDVSEWTIYRWIQIGRLRAIRPGHRWLVLREDVERMLMPTG